MANRQRHKDQGETYGAVYILKLCKKNNKHENVNILRPVCGRTWKRQELATDFRRARACKNRNDNQIIIQ